MEPVAHPYVIAGPALEDDALDLVQDVRPMDELEWVGGTGEALYPRLRQAISTPNGFARSLHSSDGPLLLIWGAAPSLDKRGWGQVWLAGTKASLEHVHSLHRVMRQEQSLLDRAFPRGSECYVHAANHTHHQWLAWLGYRAVRAQRMEPWGLMFIHFERSANDVRAHSSRRSVPRLGHRPGGDATPGGPGGLPRPA